jgi:antitoxin HicB
MKKNIEYYIKLPYKTIIIPDPYGGFFVKVEELEGCMSQGETEEEALKNIKEAKELWLETAIERNIKIPEPEMEEYSGKFVLRLPKSLHRKLANAAKKDNSSLNQYINYLLSERNQLCEIKNLIDKRIADIKIIKSEIEWLKSKSQMQTNLEWQHDFDQHPYEFYGEKNWKFEEKLQ